MTTGYASLNPVAPPEAPQAQPPATAFESGDDDIDADSEPDYDSNSDSTLHPCEKSHPQTTSGEGCHAEFSLWPTYY
ncbi:hypothetical protein PM082_023562 [Marasmius tenuissimus]|nr:hypothetical protein PM082_023562 [Marasmius tenuissimus]